MILTIGMMVKNEEKHLEECLQSLQPILNSIDSELVIVDTGSEDKTVEIAKKYTNRVYFHKWNNNFSEIRNKVISYAEGEWFFCIDGDEVLENYEEIIEFFKSREYLNYNSASMIVKNYTINNNKDIYGLCEGIRFFKNDGSYKYKGRVHNNPIYKKPTKKILCTLEHYGYVSDDVQLMEKKFKRTSTILKQELEKDPDNLYYRYQLAVTYSMHKDFEEALETISEVYEKITPEMKKDYKYIYNEYAHILISNEKFVECEELCRKELNLSKEDEVFKIDMLYYMAKSQGIQKKYEDSINNYKKYIDMLTKWEMGELPIDLAIKVMTSSARERAYNDIAIMEHYNKNYEEAISYVFRIKQEEYICRLYDLIIDSILKSKNYKLIKDIYFNRIRLLSDNAVKIFHVTLEQKLISLEDDVRKSIINELIMNENYFEDDYIQLNRFRLCTDKVEKAEIYNYLINNIDMNEVDNYYGDILYWAIKQNNDISSILENTKYSNIIHLLNYCRVKYEDFCNDILCYLQSDLEYKSDIVKNKVISALTRIILMIDKTDDSIFKEIFSRYVESGIDLVKAIYSRSILDNTMVCEVDNNEHGFFIYMMKAQENKENKKEYIKYMRYALKCYPAMKKGIENLMKLINEEIENNNVEISRLKKMLIRNLNVLLEASQIQQAKEVLASYKGMFGEDADIYSIESVIHIMENDIEEAIEVLVKSVGVNPQDFDSLYNLAYCHELQDDIKQAIRYYRRAWFYLDNQVSEKELLLKIYSLEYRCNDDEKLENIYTYYIEVKEFINLRLKGNMNIKYKDIVKSEKPDLKRNTKVLFGAMEIANQMNTYSEGLNSKNINAYTLNKCKTYLNYNSDFTIEGDCISEKQIDKIALLIAEFDIFHLFFGTSLLKDYNDLPVLKELGKKVVMNYWGSDVRIKSIAEKNNKYVKVKCKNENMVKNNMKFISNYIDTCIVGDKELYQYVHKYFKRTEFLNAAIIVGEESKHIDNDLTIETKENDTKITIVHAPTSKEIKGSRYIIKAIENLKRKYNIDLKLVENMPNREAKKIYNTADIIVDQILGGTYGIFAIEAMSIGKPVITYIADAYKDGYPSALPIISANPDNIEEVLEDKIVNLDKTKQQGQQGFEYVKKYHDTYIIAENLISIYSRL